MKITSSNYEVFDSGTVISFENEPITFHLAKDLKVKITFRDSEEVNNEQALEYNPISENELEIILLNFYNSLGTGNTKPLQVGTLNNKSLF